MRNALRIEQSVTFSGASGMDFIAESTIFATLWNCFVV